MVNGAGPATHADCKFMNLIYQLQCTECNAFYIGEACGSLSDRMNGHRFTTTVSNPDLPVAIHTQSHQIPVPDPPVSCFLLLRKATVIWPKVYIFVLFHLYMSQRRSPAGRTKLSSVLGKCRPVTPYIFVCFLSFQVFPYYITTVSPMGLHGL